MIRWGALSWLAFVTWGVLRVLSIEAHYAMACCLAFGGIWVLALATPRRPRTDPSGAGGEHGAMATADKPEAGI